MPGRTQDCQTLLSGSRQVDVIVSHNIGERLAGLVTGCEKNQAFRIPGHKTLGDPAIYEQQPKTSKDSSARTAAWGHGPDLREEGEGLAKLDAVQASSTTYLHHTTLGMTPFALLAQQV